MQKGTPGASSHSLAMMVLYPKEQEFPILHLASFPAVLLPSCCLLPSPLPSLSSPPPAPTMAPPVPLPGQAV